jgi:MFS family permease
MEVGNLLLTSSSWSLTRNSQAPAVGWQTGYEIALLVVSIVLLFSFVLWEKHNKHPIMPLQVFRAPSFSAILLVVLLAYMSFGILLWYSVSWQQTLRQASVLDIGIRFIPFGIGSLASVALAAWLIPRVAAQWIIAIGIGTVIVGNILLATMPTKQSYWPQVFPAILLSGFCPDLVYVAAQLIASNSVGRRHQGVAGSLIGTLNLYGNSLGLGFAGTIEAEVSGYGADIVSGYRGAFYFAVAIGIVGLLLNFAFVKMPKDEREGWDEALEIQEVSESTVSATAVDRRG